MAQLHDATLTPSKIELITGWITGQRWYTGKGSAARLRTVGRWRLDDPAGEVGCEVYLVADDSGPEPVVYQVPLTYRGAPLAGAESALVGTMEHSVLGHRWVYDGCQDPVFAGEVLRLVQGRVRAASSTVSDAPDPGTAGHPHPGWVRPLTVRAARVLAGEQSNTSIVQDCVDADGAAVSVITKVFRVLSPGHNPDIEVQGVLSAAGSTRVPRSVGHVTGAWRPDSTLPRPEDSPAPEVRGDLAFTAEFLGGAQDAWRVALEQARAGRSFAERATALGEATAEVHALLAQHLPTRPATRPDTDAVIAGMHTRLDAACAAVPELEPLRARIAGVLDLAREVTWPAFQRVHGDYHLGQVLDVPHRGWVLIDFEGEPLRPMAERVQPDQPLRDIAGMLRSFDYVGGTLERRSPAAAPLSSGRAAAAGTGLGPRAWVAEAQAAFLDGYARAAGADPREHAVLLAAYHLDKALYEVVYEARNRPTWLPIPVTAITRLIPEVPT